MTVTTEPDDPATILLVDLDGTITDSIAGIVNSFRHALQVVDAPAAPPEIEAGVAGPPMIDTLATLGLQGETAARALAAYHERYTDVGWRENAVFDGMAGVLGDLAAAGRTMAVATSKNERAAQRILDHFGLAGHFEVITGASDDGSRRHKSDVIAEALARLGVTIDPNSGRPTTPVVMVGDRAHDLEGAARFGIPAIIVSWGYALDGEADEANWTVGSIAHLREVLGV